MDGRKLTTTQTQSTIQTQSPTQTHTRAITQIHTRETTNTHTRATAAAIAKIDNDELEYEYEYEDQYNVKRAVESICGIETPNLFVDNISNQFYQPIDNLLHQDYETFTVNTVDGKKNF
jgi:hypothetical protein